MGKTPLKSAGEGNMYLLDNCSTGPTVIGIPRNAEQKGLNALWDTASHKDFLEKGEIIAGLIRRLTGHTPMIEAPTSRY